jgi:hypothetical protein
LNPISKYELSLIAGGYSSYHRTPTTVLASAAQVSANPCDVAPSSDEYGDSVSHCNQYSHKAITPKNGDRNAKGQIFSWGNWWDDDH